MVVCIIALIVFGFLGIFSATHRPLAKEAMDCVFRKMTLRPCNTGLDQRLKTIVSMKFMKHHKGLGQFIHKHFETISLILTIIFVVSTIITIISLFNFFAYGNCNGPTSTELCLLNPESYTNSNLLSWLFPPTPEQVKMVSGEGLPTIGSEGAPIRIIEVGCFTCPFTKSREPIVAEMLEKYGDKVEFSFKYFPLPAHKYSFEAAEAAECARDQGKFWEYKEVLFERQLECTQQETTEDLTVLYKEFAKNLSLNETEFNQCVDTRKHQPYIEAQKQENIGAGIYGTPTFFINGKVLVSPGSLEEFSKVIDAELKELEK
ncbi:MAG: hypothetical protein COV47_05975 [Candidatus Diapherotrites archaeon CG11_big_fil_rev_8_21_14_0_20_37_9]|nr:MAG: hypothetical protein COV47_05975 [Candidatus Diapherotrites archaeon CG11_big_fil_rev_8_21_14_0_20_37_9]